MVSADAAPQMLLVNAAACRNPPYNARLVELVLKEWQDAGMSLEELNYKGETALHAAVAVGDAKVRQKLRCS
jgi:hypothetical protein